MFKALGKTLIFLIITYQARADNTETKQKCTLSSLTRNCDFFKERKDQALIYLEDGTWFENPLYEAPKDQTGTITSSATTPSTISNYPYDYKNTAKSYNSATENLDMGSYLLNQYQILKILSETKLPLLTQLTLSNLGVNLVLNKGDLKVSVPWPITQKDTVVFKTITTHEFMEQVQSSIGNESYQKLMKVLEAEKKSYNENMEKFQRSQQEIMAQIEIQKKQQQEAYQKQLALEKAKLEARKARLKELFEYAQSSVKQIVSNGKTEKDLTSVEKNALDRINLLKIVDFDNPYLPDYSSCKLGLPGAFYSSTHKIIICPGLAYYPDSQLAFILGHEIFHAITSCRIQIPIMKVNQEQLVKFYNLRSQKNLPKEAFLEDLFSNPQDLIVEDLELVFNDENLTHQLILSGAISEEIAPIKSSGPLFDKEYKCLIKTGNFSENTQEDFKYMETYLEKTLPPFFEPKYKKIRENTKKRYLKALSKYPQCLNSAHPSQMGEVMSDMGGALVEEAFLRENPPHNEVDQLAAISFWLKKCQEDTPKEQIPESYNPKEISKIISSNYPDEHPIDPIRVSKIIFTLPNMAQMFKCEPFLPACFNHLSLIQRNSKSSTDKMISPDLKPSKEKGDK